MKYNKNILVEITVFLIISVSFTSGGTVINDDGKRGSTVPIVLITGFEPFDIYEVLGYLAEQELPIKAGFLHVPLLVSQDPEGMDLEMMVEAVTIAITTSLV